MRIGVLGTGSVGHLLATKFTELGHEVRMGSRQAGNEKAVAWVQQAGERASEGTFAGAAAFGDVVVNATSGDGSLEALEQAGADSLAGKPLIDVSNPLDHSGSGRILSVCNDDSIGERIQRAHPQARVVKGFNTVPGTLMVNPAQLSQPHSLPYCGDDAGAKQQFVELARSMGWSEESLLDLGGIERARGMEMYVAYWLALVRSQGTYVLSTHVVR